MKKNHILYTLMSRHLHRDAVQVLNYAFIDVSKEAVARLIRKLQDLPMTADDNAAAEAIASWYISLPKGDLVGFPMTDGEYQQKKASNIANIIKSGASENELKEKALLDIGAGDCAMTYLVSKKLNMEACAIDIQTEIDWGGQTSSDKVVKNEYMQKLSKQYVYDGRDLLGTLGNKKFKVIMLNHSLHHFPSFSAQQNCFRQIAELLEKDGVLFLSEHDNCHNDDVLELSHLLLNLRYSLDKFIKNKQLKQNTQHSTDNNSRCITLDLEKAKQEYTAVLDMEKFKQEYGTANYFSKNIIDYLAKRFGFQPVTEKISMKEDVSKTIFYYFRKAATPNPSKNPLGFFDDSPEIISRASNQEKTTSKQEKFNLRTTL
ncbi:class I SAM-dependent methyltransferase [Legionella cardiaca]|uniref:Methyltransferase domain-containing protein n=1 Tax=Legionella cardiaca TaxID=1071983 RepID=A0ABY8AU27_9GAMM|nr:methyltransferase domain-containing protein [Legionella cardiaca]WED43691.1 methyltransferase domain-containing protein [Legionella cardiaca]